MTEMEAIKARHSVHVYLDTPIPPEMVAELRSEINACNEEGELNIQLVTEEPYGFDSPMGRIGKFSGVRNYVALVGQTDITLDERCGYYGERIAIKAQMLGLNSCWAGTSCSKQNVKNHIKMATDDRLVAVIALGYGKDQGKPHKSKSVKMLALDGGKKTEWFTNGMNAVLLAPTYMNQQSFLFRRTGDKVSVMPGTGPFGRTDMGIAKYHFEVGSGRDDCWQG